MIFYRTHTRGFKHIKVSNVRLSLGSSAYIGLGFLKSKSCLTFVVYHFHKETCVWEDVYNLTKIEFAGEEQSERVSLWAFGHLSCRDPCCRIQMFH